MTTVHDLMHWLDDHLPWDFVPSELVYRTEGRVALVAGKCQTCGRISGALELCSSGPMARALGVPREDLEGPDDGKWSPMAGGGLSNPVVVALMDATAAKEPTP